MSLLSRALLLSFVVAAVCAAEPSVIQTPQASASPCNDFGDTECEPKRMSALYAAPEKPRFVHRVSFSKGGISSTIRGESQGWENSYVLRLSKGQRLHLKHHKRDCVGLEVRSPSGKALYRSTSNADFKLDLPEKGDYTIHTIGYMGAHGRNYYNFTVTVL